MSQLYRDIQGSLFYGHNSKDMLFNGINVLLVILMWHEQPVMILLSNTSLQVVGYLRTFVHSKWFPGIQTFDEWKETCFTKYQIV